MSRSVVGIDIGSSRLKLALYNGKNIIRLAEEPMPEHLIRNGAVISSEAMAQFLKETLKKHKISVKHAAMILPSSQVFVHQAELPPMTRTQFKLNLPYEFRDFITEDKDKYYYDYAMLRTILNEAGEPVRMRVLAAAAAKQLIQDYRELCRLAGLKLVAAIPAEMAYIHFLCQFEVNFSDEVGEEICLIDLGHIGSRIYFFSGESLDAVYTGERGGAEAAEVLERPEVKGCFQNIAHEIWRTVNFYNYSNPERKIKKVWICGGGSRIRPLINEIRTMLDAELYSVGESIDISAQPELVNTCIAAMGAVINGDPMRNTINLARRDHERISFKVVMPAVLILTLLVGVFSKYAVMDRFLWAERVQGEAVRAEERAAELKQALEGYDEVALAYERYFSEALRSSDMPLNCMEVLALVEKDLMAWTDIGSLRFEGNAVSLQLTGSSLSELSQILERLSREPSVKSVELFRANTEGELSQNNGTTITMTITLQEVADE